MQDAETQRVLMLGYMNREALAVTHAQRPRQLLQPQQAAVVAEGETFRPYGLKLVSDRAGLR